MEEINNLSFVLGRTGAVDLSFSTHSSCTIPPTNNPTLPLLGTMMSTPVENPMAAIRYSVRPPYVVGSFPPFVVRNQYTIAPRIAFRSPTPCPSSWLRTNDVNLINNPLGSRLIGHLPTTNHVPMAVNTFNAPLPFFQSPGLSIQNSRYLYNPAGRVQVPLMPRLQTSPSANNMFSLTNQVPFNNIQHGHSINPFLANPNTNHLYSQGHNCFDNVTNLNPNIPDLQSVNLAFRCIVCSADFPTAQALGGHMSSHSKARKKREKLEEGMRRELAQKTKLVMEGLGGNMSSHSNTNKKRERFEEEILRELKKTKLVIGTSPVHDHMSKIARAMMMANNKEVVRVPGEDDAAWKGKNIVVEIPDDISDETVINSE